MADLPHRPEDVPAADKIAVGLKEAARLTSLSPRLISAYVASGQIPHLRVGRRLLFRPDALRQWAAAREKGGRS